MISLTPKDVLPEDGTAGTLVGRVWLPQAGGPAVVAVRADGVFDVTARFPTVSALCEESDPAAALRATGGERIGDFEAILANTPPDSRDKARPHLLAPVDLQVLKAAGVTFAISMLERVIEERARGNPSSADAIRKEVVRLVGDDLSKLKPGSEQAMKLKQVLIDQNAWSQYLEVGIGPDAEVFTKAPTLSSVGSGMDAGLHPKSTWNNPEPEVVLVVSAAGKIVGAALGNDVNLRDFEGRSALLLSKAKDNNASCAIGPLLRLFDQTFSLDDVRKMDVGLTVTGADGFVLEGHSSISKISRDPTDLVAQTIGPVHQYPDGFALFLGTMFAPVKDRDAKGEGFTHKRDDIVTIAAPQLGKLVNRMRNSDECEPWTFGVGALMKNLAQRKVL
ncbi:fumarylacetoacetate (FAA) hydrolase family protein [Bradyrhizobium sp. USDA 4518]|uniref:Fumarylacetoacetate hydrolase family protein n=1 Tax=Bradyrhizobium brasilense TaxID=1419277 RepID=A0ABY8J9U7_9BRAD|nr:MULTISPECIES: fumarylacetoacetate hydrolase family protein [Bradyrhizobium]KRQ03876.1 fumarylacetoacetate hydrolase [Bradyrhizobium pachyrhizi]MCP1834763.1 fumarylacetoacetate (FAA) hydrolase family protein [Bradyrhizobium sp. USDA 4545]MCP1853873.1 fumarylacetoacetate (FAA) hydrolase family protein [Bradyrhizobium sp. USDA 4541]MCP1919508.1 fumarylacetoacetate (FAA) hydrolase family protein [Bradyrhizobium sp. USDA 4532]OMI11088.1 fumarylacetoacetate hydrolase [Bradyrhizobium brasilense]